LSASGVRESSAGKKFRRTSCAPRFVPRWLGEFEN
jgi:hypothetical protein